MWSSTPTVATLAAELQEQLFSQTPSGPTPTPTASVFTRQMPIDPLQALVRALQTLASSSPSEPTEPSATIVSVYWYPKAPRLKKINLEIGFWKKSICDWKLFFQSGKVFSEIVRLIFRLKMKIANFDFEHFFYWILGWIFDWFFGWILKRKNGYFWTGKMEIGKVLVVSVWSVVAGKPQSVVTATTERSLLQGWAMNLLECQGSSLYSSGWWLPKRVALEGCLHHR